MKTAYQNLILMALFPVTVLAYRNDYYPEERLCSMVRAQERAENRGDMEYARRLAKDIERFRDRFGLSWYNDAYCGDSDSYEDGFRDGYYFGRDPYYPPRPPHYRPHRPENRPYPGERPHRPGRPENRPQKPQQPPYPPENQPAYPPHLQPPNHQPPTPSLPANQAPNMPAPQPR